jgi:acyl-coenzyme A thioesterase PaaI-like protein
MAESLPYPPGNHLLRVLPLEVELASPERALGHLEVVPHLGIGGRAALGPVLTVADVLAGLVVARAVAPDWLATSSLTFHRCRDARVGDHLVVDATLLRAGSSTAVVEVEARGGGGERVGEGLASFVRLPRRAEVNPDITSTEPAWGQRTGFGDPGSQMAAPYDEEIGITADPSAPGSTTTPLAESVRNSFGAMNGGVVASVALATARSAAAGLGVADPVVEDVVVHYLGQGRTGPVVGSSIVLRAGTAAGDVAVRVEVADRGADRLMAVAHVTVRPGPSRAPRGHG